VSDFNDRVIAEFRSNGGRVGPPFEGAPLLLLHTTGARTGTERVSPMMYAADGDRYLVFASKAGAPDNPDWFHNLVAHPRASVEVPADSEVRTVQVEAVVLAGEERDKAYAAQAGAYPGFADYQEKTTRVIPVVALVPVA
jgi:deazaflavin-dependent oxidoreductase (nitroreductase family)